MKFLPKMFKEEKGQVMVIVALAMVVLLGFTALAVDGGALYLARRQAATAADAAALAGAIDLSNKDKAFQTVDEYVYKNKAEVVSKETPYEYENGKFDSNRIEVICSKHVDFTFAKVLGFDETDVSARAVAEKIPWEARVLPFLNLDDQYWDSTTTIEAWEKVSSGDFESILEKSKCDNGGGYTFVSTESLSEPHFEVDYKNGITITKGEVSNIKPDLNTFCRYLNPGDKVYLFSLSESVIKNGYVKLKDGTFKELSKLKNKDIIDQSQIVLLECTFNSYNEQQKTFYMSSPREYDLNNNIFPTATSHLVE